MKTILKRNLPCACHKSYIQKTAYVRSWYIWHFEFPFIIKTSITANQFPKLYFHTHIHTMPKWAYEIHFEFQIESKFVVVYYY